MIEAIQLTALLVPLLIFLMVLAAIADFIGEDYE